MTAAPVRFAGSVALSIAVYAAPMWTEKQVPRRYAPRNDKLRRGALPRALHTTQFVIPKRRSAVEESAFCRQWIRCTPTADFSPSTSLRVGMITVCFSRGLLGREAALLSGRRERSESFLAESPRYCGCRVSGLRRWCDRHSQSNTESRRILPCGEPRQSLTYRFPAARLQRTWSRAAWWWPFPSLVWSWATPASICCARRGWSK